MYSTNLFYFTTFWTFFFGTPQTHNLSYPILLKRPPRGMGYDRFDCIQVDDDNGPTPGGGGSEDPEAQAGPSSSRTEQPKRKQVRCTSYLYCI